MELYTNSNYRKGPCTAKNQFGIHSIHVLCQLNRQLQLCEVHKKSLENPKILKTAKNH